tara:strand:- start:1373 stop:2566 length:1194 start_codon:yes stop_codon:yes gene_type:complete
MERTKKNNLVLIWLAQAISQSGDSIYQLALLWLVLDLTASPILTGFIAMSAYLPALILGLYAGVLSDRINRLKLMVYSNVFQSLMVVLIPLALFYSNNIWVICILAFLRSCFNTFFQPALQSFIPILYKKNILMNINAVLATSGQIAWLLGPLLAGFLLSVLTLENLFFIDAASFVIAAILLQFVKTPEKVLEQKINNQWSDLKKGLVYLLSKKPILQIIIITFINNIFIMGPAVVGVPILVKTILGGTASDFAFVEGCMAFGALFGSFLVTRLKIILPKGILWSFGLIIDGATFCMLFWAESIAAIMIMIFFHGIGIPFIIISRTSIIQTYTSSQYHGRLFSTAHLGVVGATAFSSALVGITAETFTIKVIFLIFGIGAALCGLYTISNKAIRKLT